MILMTHPQHGWHNATNTAERDTMLKNGWKEPVVEPEADPAEADAAGHTVASVRAQLDAAGIAYDKRLGLAKLIALLPA